MRNPIVYIVTKEEMLEVKATYKHQCDFCTRRFKTDRAIHIHRDSCPYNYDTTEATFEPVYISAVFGHKDNRWFKTKYRGHRKLEWSREHLIRRDGCHEVIRQFWSKSAG